MKKLLIIYGFIATMFAGCKDSYEMPVPEGPAITQLVPSIGLGGTKVLIKGKRFGKDISQNVVKFSGVNAEIVTANDTLITVIAPNEGSTGNVTISANKYTSKGPVFVYGVQDAEYDYVSSTYAGSGIAGDSYGSLLEAAFRLPNGVTFDPTTGDLIVADRTAFSIKRISKAGVVTKIAGAGTSGTTDGPLLTARFNNPYKTAVDKAGNIYVVDNGSNRIRKIDLTTNLVSTLAGSGTAAYNDGQGTAASFNVPTGIAVDEQGNVYIADAANHAVRKITPSGYVSTLAGNGIAGTVDGVWPNVRMNRPTAIALGPDGFLYVADRYGQRIRKIDKQTGKTTTIAGSGGTGASNGAVVDGEVLKARFNNPWGIEVDKEGAIYVSELEGGSFKSHTVRMIKNGQVYTIGGSTSFNVGGFAEGVPGVSRYFNPTDVAADNDGNIFVADMNNFRIRKIVRIKK